MGKPKGSSKKTWGDDEEDEVEIDNNGIRERTRITENTKGQKVKVTMKIKVNEVKVKLPKGLVERRDLPRFGEAKAGEQNVTIISKEFEPMEHPDDALLESKDNALKNTLKAFLDKRTEREMAAEAGVNLDAIGDDLNYDPSAKPEDSEEKVGKYIPPGKLGGASSSLSALADSMPVKDTTIRVSNLTKNVTEDDVRDLFEPFGRVVRVAVPKTERVENGRTIKEPRGFAYVTFLRADEAEIAFNTLQGYGYDHLILRLEWSKPMIRDPATSGLSGGFVSGYGTKLAQDTKEKVHGYTDQSAHNQASTGWRR